MIVFGQVKLAGRKDLSKNFAVNPGRHLVSVSKPTVFVRRYGRKWRPDIAGTRTRGQDCGSPKNSQQLFIGDQDRIEIYLQGLRMIA
jgi:hypothetical protein